MKVVCRFCFIQAGPAAWNDKTELVKAVFAFVSRLSLSYRLHYASVHHSVPRNLKTKKRRKIKIDVNVPQGTRKWSANFQFVRRRKLQNCRISSVYVIFLQAGAGCSGADCKPIVFLVCSRRMRLSADGRMSCRQSAPTSFLVYRLNVTNKLLNHSWFLSFYCVVLYISLPPSVIFSKWKKERMNEWLSDIEFTGIISGQFCCHCVPWVRLYMMDDSWSYPSLALTHRHTSDTTIHFLWLVISRSNLNYDEYVSVNTNCGITHHWCR